MSSVSISFCCDSSSVMTTAITATPAVLLQPCYCSCFHSSSSFSGHYCCCYYSCCHASSPSRCSHYRCHSYSTPTPLLLLLLLSPPPPPLPFLRCHHHHQLASWFCQTSVPESTLLLWGFLCYDVSHPQLHIGISWGKFHKSTKTWIPTPES